MLCRFCQNQIRGTGCQTQSQANQCANNRGRETDDWDDHISSLKTERDFDAVIQLHNGCSMNPEFD